MPSAIRVSRAAFFERVALAVKAAASFLKRSTAERLLRSEATLVVVLACVAFRVSQY